MRKIMVFTGTRADWGLLSPVCKALQARPDTRISVVATNMHLSDRFGKTVGEIRADGFDALELPMDAEATTPEGQVAAMGQCMTGAAALISREKPDMALLLGDRFEMLAIASACLMMRVPIAHIAGGEISEGAIDDCIRHAITKMSALHLTATEPYRQRVIAMGEDPDRVINTGAIGVWNIAHSEIAGSDELTDFLGMEVDRNTAIVTYHPATLDDADIDTCIDALTDALDTAVPGLKSVITYPNNDARGNRVIERLEAYASARRERVRLVPSLGRRRYLAAISLAGVVVGNSSSGIVEVPSAGVPTVDIGMRQRGRIAGPSVIHCGDSREDIAEAIRRALTPEMQALARLRNNPYGQPETLAKMVKAIAETPLEELRVKKFHDINPIGI